MKRARTRSVKFWAWAGVASALMGASEVRAQSWGAVQLGTLTSAPGVSPYANIGFDRCNGVAVDASGNTYCAGSTTGILGEQNAVPAVAPYYGYGWGPGDAFVMKIAPSGTIEWVIQLGQTTKAPNLAPALLAQANLGDDACLSVAVANGFVYCGGSTTGVIAEPNAGGKDAFVMKLSASDGAIQWVKQFGATTSIPGANAQASRAGDDVCKSIAVDSLVNGSVFCGGSTSGSFKELNVGPAGTRDLLVMRLAKSTGNLSWVTHFGNLTRAPNVPQVSANKGDEECNGVAVGSSVFCVGGTNGHLAEAPIFDDAFVLKLRTTNGARQAIKQYGATTKWVQNALANRGRDACTSVAIDQNGDVYCAGFTTGMFSEPNGTGVSPTYPSFLSDAFVMKLSGVNLSGIWVRQYGALSRAANAPALANSREDGFTSVAVDAQNNVYCSGYTGFVFSEENGYGQGVLGNSTSYDVIVAKLDSQGNPGWGKQLGRTTVAPPTPGGDPTYYFPNSGNDDRCFGVAVAPGGDIVCAGKTDNTITEINGLTNNPMWVNGNGDDALLIRLRGADGSFAQ